MVLCRFDHGVCTIHTKVGGLITIPANPALCSVYKAELEVQLAACLKNIEEGQIVASEKAEELSQMESRLCSEREKWMQYAGVLFQELSSCIVIAWTHGWRSSLADLGQRLRQHLNVTEDDLRDAANRAYADEIVLDKQQPSN